MIFGQGAIRCHPYVYQEIQALSTGDIAAFDHAIWHHMGALVRNTFRTALLSLTQGYLARSPVNGSTARYYRKLVWASATFALLTDLALLAYGGSLKRKEKLTGRFADVLSWLYLGTATLRRFEAEGRQRADLPLVHWAMQYAFAQMQDAFEGILTNMDIPVLGWVLRRLVLPVWRLNPIGTLPSDRLGSQVAELMQQVGEGRDRLTAGIHIPTDTNQALGRSEHAFTLVHQVEPLLKSIKAASRAGKLPSGKPEQMIENAVAIGLITEAEKELIQKAELVRNDAIQVDAFTAEDYQRGVVLPQTQPILIAEDHHVESNGESIVAYSS
jgi:acyl-CoA dehydrogenase